MPQKERLRVWLGELKKTSGGLTKGMLMKNKRGKIVSKRKSDSSKNAESNNLAKLGWLRSKGDKFGGEPKGLKKEEKPAPKPAPKPKKAAPKPAPKPKKAAPKKAAPKDAAPKITKLEPMKAGQTKDLSKVSVGNIIVKPKTSSTAFNIKKAKTYKHTFGYDEKKVIAKVGPFPPGITWSKL